MTQRFFFIIQHLVLSFKNVELFKNTVIYRLYWLLTTRVRLLGSNTIIARDLVITKFPHVQTFECYIIIVTPSEWARNPPGFVRFPEGDICGTFSKNYLRVSVCVKPSLKKIKHGHTKYNQVRGFA